MTIGNRIKKIRHLLKLPRSVFEPNISSSTLRHWEEGSYEPKDKNLIHLINVFKRHGAVVSTLWLKTAEGIPPTIQGVVLDTVYDETYLDKQKTIKQFESSFLEKDEILFRDIHRIKELYSDCDTFLVCAGEMSPRFKIGDYVFGARIDYKKYKIIDLEPAIVTLKNGKKFLCYLSYSQDVDRISFVYEHGNVEFRKSDILHISIVVIHRRCIHLS